MGHRFDIRPQHCLVPLNLAPSSQLRIPSLFNEKVAEGSSMVPSLYMVMGCA